MAKGKIIVGITGSLCTGKTTVTKLFSKFGADVLDADALAHRSLSDAKIKKRIINLLGRQILAAGSIDRKKARQIVFNNRVLLKRLSDIVHPYVKKRLKGLIKKSKSEIIVLDVPLLIESGLDRLVDVVVVVISGRQEQIERAKRRKINRYEAIKIINSQMPLLKKRRLADFIIDNNGTIQHTEEQALAIFNRLKTGVEGGKNTKE